MGFDVAKIGKGESRGKSGSVGIKTFFADILENWLWKPFGRAIGVKVSPDLTGGGGVMALNEMSVVAIAGDRLFTTTNDDEFDISSEGFDVLPAGKSFPLIKANQEEEAGF